MIGSHLYEFDAKTKFGNVWCRRHARGSQQSHKTVCGITIVLDSRFDIRPRHLKVISCLKCDMAQKPMMLHDLLRGARYPYADCSRRDASGDVGLASLFTFPSVAFSNPPAMNIRWEVQAEPGEPPRVSNVASAWLEEFDNAQRDIRQEMIQAVQSSRHNQTTDALSARPTLESCRYCYEWGQGTSRLLTNMEPNLYYCAHCRDYYTKEWIADYDRGLWGQRSEQVRRAREVRLQRGLSW